MSEPPEPDFSLNLTWQGGERFLGASKHGSMALDGEGRAGTSPVQALAFALGGCMSIDVVQVLEKGRFPIKALSSEVRVFRTGKIPRSVTGIELHFTLRGKVPDDRVARAIALSREKYCSVWHSLNPSISLVTSFSVNP